MNTEEGLEKLLSSVSHAQLLKSYVTPLRIAFYSYLLQLCRNKKISFSKKTIADIGCGTGHLLYLLSKDADDAVLSGFDLSDKVLEIAKKICPKASFYKFDIYQSIRFISFN